MEYQINDEIKDKEVRLINDDGKQLGIFKINEAIIMSINRGLDLVKIATQSIPPVCKIMDYGKFKFEQIKKEKEAKKNQHVIGIKEIRLSPHIDTNDFLVKINHLKRFIKNGDKVKVSIRFRGREMAHTKLGYDLLNKLINECSDIIFVEKQPKLEGRQIVVFVIPKIK